MEEIKQDTAAEIEAKAAPPKRRRGRPTKKAPGYAEEIAEKKRCPTCLRPTVLEDYKHVRSEKITRTCRSCRERIHKSYVKTARKTTMRETIADLSAKLAAALAAAPPPELRSPECPSAAAAAAAGF